MAALARSLVGVAALLLVGFTGCTSCLAADKSETYERMLRDSLKVVPQDSRLPISRFVVVKDVGTYFPGASEIDVRTMSASAMFTYSRDGADLIYINTNHVFFREAEAAYREYGALSGFRYALAAKIAHEVCHLAQPKTRRQEVPCYETELRVFHQFVEIGYLNHARQWAAETEQFLRDDIQVEQRAAAQ